MKKSPTELIFNISHKFIWNTDNTKINFKQMIVALYLHVL